MRFISCFSGLEGASLAVNALGWECVGVAEIEPFPAAIIKHRFPHVTNLGDVLADDFLDRAAALKPDVVMGGPPCQDFSKAGLRAGLDGARGNLTLRWAQIIHATKPRIALTENVPGWLSVNGGHAFSAFLAALVGCDSELLPPAKCGGRWTDAGMVAGPKGRAAWRILDAQYQGLAQRRERMFVVADFGTGADPAEVLFERAGLSGNPAPRREAGQRPAGTLSARTEGGGGLGTDFDLVAFDTTQITSAANYSKPKVGDPCHPLAAGAHAPAVAFGGNNTRGPIEVATACSAHGVPYGRLDFESETFIAHSLRAEGFDASEDGTGRGTPIVPVQAFYSNESRCDNIPPPDVSPPLKVGSGGTSGNPPAIAFSCKDHGADATVDLSPTLRAGGFTTSHANAGVMPAGAYVRGINSQGGKGHANPFGDTTPTLGADTQMHAVAFDLRGREGGAQFEGPHDTANIRAASGGSSRSYVAAPLAFDAYNQTVSEIAHTLLAFDAHNQTVSEIAHMLRRGTGASGDAIPQTFNQWAVRRLTPSECEKLQGVPVDHTMIPWRGKPASECPDGPRYRALGNSWAVPVVAWIAGRVDRALSTETA